MNMRFLGKDPESFEGDSAALFATDRAERKTYIARGWVVTDPEALAELGENPPGETLIEIPADVLRFFVQDEQGKTAEPAYRRGLQPALSDL